MVYTTFPIETDDLLFKQAFSPEDNIIGTCLIDEYNEKCIAIKNLTSDSY